MTARAVLAALALAAPTAARGYEPRFDHRDEQGPLVEVLLVHDTVAVSGKRTVSGWRPATRIAYGFDPVGEGNELLFGATFALRAWDPDAERIDLAFDARYRSYAGTEELKTFFEVGLAVSALQRIAVGPLVGLGLGWDFSREAGLFASALFATGLGGARVASFGATAGFHLRWE